MSPIQNNHYCLYVPPTIGNYSSGTWTSVAGIVPGTICKRLTGSAGWKGFGLHIPFLSSPTQLTGTRFMSLEIDYEVLTDVLVSDILVLRRITSPGDGSPYTAESLTYTIDAAHDTIGERGAVDQHRMIITPNPQPWIDNSQFIQLNWSLQKNAGTVFRFLGAFANYYWRD
jgi:hypothetical protein